MKILLFFLLAMVSVAVTGFAEAQSPVPTEADIRNILAKRIDVEKKNVGIVVGVVSPQRRFVVAHGALNQGDPRPLNGDTVFEIGSMTKVFTSLVLMDMVRKGEVKLDDPVSKYLPTSVHVSERNGKQITLAELSMQHSGLPLMPDNFHPANPANPYADYTPNKLYEFLSHYTLTRDPGARYEYSNVGVGLLGLALARRAGTDYETLVKTRVLQPLGMKDTGITLSADMRTRMAVGHNAMLKPVGNWDLGALAGAGALRSTANDMLTFLAANLGLIPTPLAADMAEEISAQRETTIPHVNIAYAWHIFTTGGKTIYWHNGGTGGYRSFMGYDPATRVGVVVLSNTEEYVVGVDDIGRHLLDSSFPLYSFPAPGAHKEITVGAKTLDAYVGRYQLAANFVVTITRSGDQLSAQATGQGQFLIFPETQTQFFANIADITITFESDPRGVVTGFVLRQNGRNHRAPRIK